MLHSKNTILRLFLMIYLINIFVGLNPLQDGENFYLNVFSEENLKRFGLTAEENKTNLLIPRLINTSSPKIQLKTQSKTLIENLDNNLSNVDGSADKVDYSTNRNYPDPKSSIQTLMQTSGQTDLNISSWNITEDNWAKIGSSPYLDDQDDNNYVWGEEGGLGATDGDQIGDFNFQDTLQTGIINSVKLRVYGTANPSRSSQSFFSVYLWDGSSWSKKMDFKGQGSYSWKEVDISLDLNSWAKINGAKIFLETEDTINQQRGGQKCDAASLRVDWQIDDTPPVINNFGVDDLATGTGRFWATVTDSQSVVANVTLEVNGTECDMSYNDTRWVSDQPVVYQGYYEYQITNASDTEGNYLSNPSEVRNYTFIEDSIAPNVLDWIYIPSTNTFRTNVTDSWGEIDTVIVNVTSIPDTTAIMAYSQDFSGNVLEYINDTIDMPNGDINFLIFVIDTKGNSYTSPTHQGSVYVNHAPAAENLTLNLSPLFSNETLVLSYVYSDEDNHGESGTEIRWYKNGILQYTFYDQTELDHESIAHTDLFPGDEWNVTVTPKDGEKFGETNVSSTVTVVNTPPTVSGVILEYIGAYLYTTSTLSIDYVYEDYDEDSEDIGNLMIIWYNNSVKQDNLNNFTTIQAGNTSKGEVWYYEIRVNDGENYSSWITSNTVLILNKPPEAVNLTITPDPSYVDSTLVANWDMQDDDGDIENESMAKIFWYKYGELELLLTNSVTINPGNLSKTQTWYFKIQVWDGANYSSLVQSGSITIQNSLPIAANVTFVSLNPVTTDNLVVQYNRTDEDGDFWGSPKIRWFTNESGSWVHQTDYDDYTIFLPSSATSKGEFWLYGIQVYDQSEYSVEVNSSPILILNTPPEVTNLGLTSNPTTTADLVATWESNDNDTGDSLTFTITWYLDGIFNSSWPTTATSAILEEGNSTKNDLWYFTIKASDGENDSDIISLASNVTILNTIPIIGNLTLTTDPTTTDDLVANYDSVDVDSVDLPLTIIIKWYKNGQEQGLPLANETTISSGNINKSQVWWFTVQAFDGDAYSTVAESAHREILNTAPVVSNLGLPSSPTTTDDLEATWDPFDADNDGLSYNIKWYKNSSGTWQYQSIYDGYTTLPASATTKGDYWKFYIQLDDGDIDPGTRYSNEFNSSQVLILNTPSEVTNLGLTSNPTTTADLVATWESNDNDTGDSLTFYAFWFLDGGLNNSLQTSINNATLSSGNTTKNQKWTFNVTVYDGEVNSTEISLGYDITIINSQPTITNPSFNETSPVAVDVPFNITYIYSDADGDQEVILDKLIVYWYVDRNYNVTYQNLTEIGDVETSVGEVWSYIIQVYDGEVYSDNVSSVQVIMIGSRSNDPPTAENLTITPTIPKTQQSLIAAYDYHDNDSDPQYGFEIRWYENNSLQAEYNNSLSIPASATSKGDVWSFSVRVFDGIIWGIYNNSTPYTVVNSLPGVFNLNLTPTPTTLDDLVAGWDSNDNDSDSLTVIVTWYVDMIENTNFANKTVIGAGNTTKGQEWNFTIQAWDGEAYSDVVSLETLITILNTAPVVDNLTLTADPITTDDLVVSYDSVDVDSVDLPLTIIVKWYKNGLEQGLPLANTTTISSGNTNKSQVWWFTIQAFDGEAYSTVKESIHREILNTAPVVSNPGLPSSSTTTDDLVATWDDFDEDNDSLSYNIKWYTNGSGSWQYQSTYDGYDTLPASTTTKGDYWKFYIQLDDGDIDPGTRYSDELNSSLVLILNTPPEVTNLGLTSNPTITADLVATWESNDNDTGDSLTFTITWYLDGIFNSSWPTTATSAILEEGNSTKNDLWYFTIKASDGENDSDIISLASNVTILNTIPIIDNLTLTTDPTTTDDLVANYDSDDVDSVDLPLTIIVKWYKNGLEQGLPLANTTTINSGNTNKSQVWWYTVRCYDGEAYSTVKESAHREILNSAPFNGSSLPIPMSPTVETGLILFESAILSSLLDLDVDDIQFIESIRWFRESIFQSDLNGSLNILGSRVNKGETWYYTIIPSDSLDTGSICTSADILILNSIPTITLAYFAESDVKTTHNLTARYLQDDADDENVSISGIRWFRSNDTLNYYLVPIYNGNLSLPYTATNKGERWKFEMEITDGENESLTWKSDHIEIYNSIPWIDPFSIKLTGGTNTSDPLHLTFLWYDDDAGDLNDTTAIFWDNGDYVNETFDFTLNSMYTRAGERWWVTIEPDDGEESGERIDSRFYGESIIIGNSVPEVNEITIQGLFNETFYYGVSFGTQLDLVLNYTVSDIDGTEEVDDYDVYLFEGYAIGSEYHWYRNRSGIIEIVPALEGKTTISSSYTQKGDLWWVQMRPRDFFGDFGETINSTKIIIGNTAPIMTGFEWENLHPTTTDDLTFNTIYLDFDGDPMDDSKTLILWFRNGNMIFGSENQTSLDHDYYNKSDQIYVIIRPFDGITWADMNYTSPLIKIVNSIPIIMIVSVYPTVVNSTDVLYLNWTYFDIDLDEENSSWRISWEKDGIIQNDFENWRFIPLANTSNDELWVAELRIYDGFNYSLAHTHGINAKSLSLSYVFDIQTSQVDPVIDNRQFIVEDENITVNYYFLNENDAIGSKIQWFKELEGGSWIEVFEFENHTTIPHNYTTVSDRWYSMITPFDGIFFWSKTNSSVIVIESRPVIHSLPKELVIVKNDTEGHFTLTVSANDIRNDITTVQFTLNDTISEIYYAERSLGDVWLYDYQIPEEEFKTYLNAVLVGQVKVSSAVEYNGQSFTIFSILSFDFTILDEAAPRVNIAYFEKNDDKNPTNLTFYVEVEEYGEGIAEVILYYYFRPVSDTNESGGSGATINQNEAWLQVPMTFQQENTSSNFFLYSVTVGFNQNNTNYDVIYLIYTIDNAGNVNPEAFDIRDYPQSINDQQIVYRPPGLPEWMLWVAGLAVFIVFAGSIVYIKFIRKPELVGLDKELVIDRITEVDDAEIMGSLEAHTIGVVISFFDQRHGPIPIITIPEILKDNYSKLVELSDRSFSGTGFTHDFEEEIPSSYDFVLAQGLRMSVISFGFALERLEARGGQENLTLNILIHKEVFPLLSQFQDEIQTKVHITHVLMNKHRSEKDKIRAAALETRKFASAIVLSYQNIYGTTDLLSEEE